MPSPTYEIAPERKQKIDEFLKDPGVLAEAEKAKENDGALPAFKAYLAPRIDTLVKTNDELRYMKDQMESVSTVPAVFKDSEVKQAIVETAQAKLINLQKEVEKWYSPQTWSPETQRKAAHIAIGGTVIVGGALLASWLWKKLTKFQKFVVGSVTAGAVGVLGYFGFKRWQIGEKIKDGVNATKEGVAEAKDAAKDYLDKEKMRTQPWLQYGLTDEQYEEARSHYAEHRRSPESALSEIQRIFAGRTNVPENTKDTTDFMEDMQKLYETREENGIFYARATIATENYKEACGTASKQVEIALGKHAVETTAAGYLALKLNAPQHLLGAGAFSAGEMKELAESLTKFVGRNPLLSLLAAGGTLSALHLAAHNSTDTWLPENLQEMQNATAKNVSLSIGQVLTPEQEAEMRRLVSELDDFDPRDVASWTERQIQKIVRTLTESVPEKVALTDSEIIQNRNSITFDRFRTHLENQRTGLNLSTREADAEKIQNIDDVLDMLAVYEASMEKHRFSGATNDTEPVAALALLEEALAKLSIRIERKNDLIEWVETGTSAERGVLSVDPTLSTEASLLNASKNIINHSDSVNAGAMEFVETIRSLQNSAIERSENLGIENKAIGMIIGNFFYFSTDTGNYLEIFAIPVKVLVKKGGPELWQSITQTGDFRELSATAGNAVARTMAFSLGVGTLTAVKRLLVGGGPILRRPSLLRGIGRSIPLLEQYRRLKQGVLGTVDLTMYRRLGYFDMRHVLDTIGATGLRPGVLRQIELGTFRQLHNIADLLGGRTIRDIVRMHGENNIPAIRNALRKEVLSRFSKISRARTPTMGRVGWDFYARVTKEANPAQTYELMLKGAGVEGDELHRIAAEVEELANHLHIDGSARTGSASPDTPTQNPESSKTPKPNASATNKGAKSAANTASETAESLAEAQSKLMDDIDNMMRSPATDDSVRALVDTLESPAAKQAIAHGDETLRSMSKAAKSLKLMKGAALPVLGTVLSGAMVALNEADIRAAEKAGRHLDADTLRSKRVTLLMEGTLGNAAVSGTFLMFGPFGWVALGGVVLVGIANEIMYSYAMEYNKDDDDYLKEDDKTLLGKVRNWSKDSVQTSALFAYLRHTTAGHEPTKEELDAFLAVEPGQESQVGGNFTSAEQVQRALESGTDEEKQKALQVLGTRDQKLVTSKMSFLQELAKHRGGDLSKLRPEDLEMADMYAELVNLDYRSHYTNDPGLIARYVAETKEKFAAMGTDLDMSDLGNSPTPEDLKRILYKNYDREWKESDLVWAMRSEKLVTIAEDVHRMKPMIEADPTKKELAFSIFQQSFIETCLSHHIAMAKAALHQYELEALFTYIESTLRPFFDNLLAFPAVGSALIDRMNGLAFPLRNKVSEAVQSSHFEYSDNASSNNYSASYEHMLKQPRNPNLGGK